MHGYVAQPGHLLIYITGLKPLNNMNKLKEIGVTMFITAAVISLIETIYFGCNLTPMSRAEEQWDVICALIVILAFSFMLAGKVLEKKNEKNI